ncbi:DNA polymerase III subunit gamma/tau [Prosthecomicrobium hirschii]|uniref:DNA polymerase III subunit gamma/tau n=1 Tax=Prosthecodimorpha hirschii TaxID=665126 RepID=UPI001128AD8E|nr:DNA polymerase III subunit gamma/tau [Prosthecomicrobium hirschii]TPQ51440.1 DNA polymerase III subunit gamma/tau [Prosthecomicrobium hirschii]
MDGLFPTDSLPETAGPTDAAKPGAAKSGAYRVLARKYRPQSFDDLIGQEPMVRTLSNAFEIGRIAQAYMLTGVRGVGKTTTARILARALNYEIPGRIDKPTIHMPEPGVHCQAIMEGRHVDVMEMDAASHTGIEDIREIIEAVRYKPATARMKVYIVDEVHMLSNAAFNGLLKTLEEPPEHVKFIFATTEIRKVPVTILSRCQRFDLRRIEAGVLTAHLRRIAEAEQVGIEDEALRLVARAAEGSVRDSLSLLDQAIAHGEGQITADQIREMLGLADRTRVIDLFGQVMRGEVAAALQELEAQYAVGADPATVIADLAEFTHFVTRLKLVPGAAEDGAATEAEVTRGRDYAEGLSLRVLGRAWQMLLKGFDEVKAAPKPLAAAEMVIVRLAYAADLPTPDEALKLLRDAGPTGGPGAGLSGGGASGPGGGGTGGGPARMAGGPQGPGGGAVPGAPTASGEPRAAPRLVASSGAMASAAPSGAQAAAVPSPAAPWEEPRAPAAQPSPSPAPVAAAPAGDMRPLNSLEDIAALAAEKRDIRLKLAIERQMRPVRIEDGRIEFSPTPEAPKDLAQELGRKLGDWTGRRWMIAISRETGGATVAEEREAARNRLVTDARADPLVAAVLKRFPGAMIVDVRVHKTAEEEAAAAAGAPILPAGSEDLPADAYIAPVDMDDPGWAPDD